jgi:hypothetical protein
MKVCAPAAAAKPPKDRSVGAAAEHYVMRRLLRQDMIAALAPAGVPNCDLVVTDELGSKVAAVQVKARRDIGSDGGWHMKKKHEAMIEPLLFYCFVDFGRGGPTDRSAGSFQAPSWPTPSNEVIRRGSRAGQGGPPKTRPAPPVVPAPQLPLYAVSDQTRAALHGRTMKSTGPRKRELVFERPVAIKPQARLTDTSSMFTQFTPI